MISCENRNQEQFYNTFFKKIYKGRHFSQSLQKFENTTRENTTTNEGLRN